MAVSLRFNLYSTLRLISFFPANGFTSNLSKYISSPSIISRVDACHASYFRRRFCAGISGALSSEEAIENQKPEAFEIKGGPDEGLDRMGKTLIVKGRVRTIRVHTRVTFMEVNDGSCVSNTQCILGPDTAGYDQVARVRSALGNATVKFFQERGFLRVPTPILTTSDCEGAGEQFCVTDLIIPNSLVDDIPEIKNVLIDWAQGIFLKPASLTVSGQLHREAYVTFLNDVYSHGPTFRAENSNTSRHLAEFWMIEAELAFADLDKVMERAAAYLQYVVRHVLENCKADLDYFNTRTEKGIIDRLDNLVEENIFQMTYTDAIERLRATKKKFEFPIGELMGESAREEQLEYLEARLDD